MAREARCADRIVLEDLRVRCIIGVHDWERVQPMEVVLGLELAVDLAPAGQSDRLEDTLDYGGLADRVVALAEASEYYLIERLAEEVAALCLAEPRAQWVRVRVEKPGAVPRARTVAVVVERPRAEPE